MARPPTGQIIERRGKQGRTFGVRFRAYKRRWYVTTEAATRADAETELRHILADVERGIWKPPVVAEPEVPKREPTFHEFASEWLTARKLEGLAENTIADLRWSLELHLLPHFASLSLSEITPQEVDRYKVSKARERQEIDDARARGERVRERGLSNSSINHTLSDLAQVLETAVEYGHIAQNPANGRRRRLKQTPPTHSWVEPQQLPALLDAAPAGVGRALLGILAGSGLRIGEALALRWRHVDLMGAGTLSIVGSKTNAGVRTVDLTAALREELREWWRESSHDRPDDYVLPSSTGNRSNPSNLRRDVLRPTIDAANLELEKDGITPIAPVTFHSLRRTYASLRCACRDDVAYTSAQIGHTDPRFTLRVYTQATKRRERLSGPHLRAFDRAIEWARMGTNDELERMLATAETTKNPV
ncbi:tyrosine-type recombinase/integrase [soil metagenome]